MFLQVFFCQQGLGTQASGPSFLPEGGCTPTSGPRSSPWGYPASGLRPFPWRESTQVRREGLLCCPPEKITPSICKFRGHDSNTTKRKKYSLKLKHLTTINLHESLQCLIQEFPDGESNLKVACANLLFGQRIYRKLHEKELDPEGVTDTHPLGSVNAIHQRDLILYG